MFIRHSPVVLAAVVVFVSAVIDEQRWQQCEGLIDGFHSLTSSKNCSQYLLCINNTAIIGTCPQDFVWNDAVNQCAPASNVTGECGSSDLLSSSDNSASCEGKAKRFYRVAGRCDMYYSCKPTSYNITSKCESGTAFDERAQLCRPSIVVDDCHPPSSSEWLAFCVNKPNGLYKNGNMCGRVLACIAYEAYEFRCPQSKPYWSAEEQQCVEELLEENNDCVWPVEALMIADKLKKDSMLTVDRMDLENGENSTLTSTMEPKITRVPRYHHYYHHHHGGYPPPPPPSGGGDAKGGDAKGGDAEDGGKGGDAKGGDATGGDAKDGGDGGDATGGDAKGGNG